jgi:uncharacterized membrane protein HdeD (DUF308 family)
MQLSLDVRNWSMFVLRGLAAIVFGILVWAFPGMALLTLVFLFGAYAIVDGVSAVVAAVSARRRKAETPRWWLVILYSAASVIAGLIAFFAPGITALALVLLIGARAIVTGGLEIAAAARLRKEIEGEWLLATTGVISILFGVVIVAFPGPGALGLLLWIGAWAIVLGLFQIGLGLRLRRVKQRLITTPTPAAAEPARPPVPMEPTLLRSP